jgi:hypothetical protein
MADVTEVLKKLGLATARGVPQLATGFVDLAALPFTMTGMLKPEQAVGSTAYLTSKGLLPPEQKGLLGETTEMVTSAINPATAAKAALAKGGLLVAAPIAYHGSPYIFDKFDISKLGTGEGAQAYGHGMYFAEAPDVARGYQMALSQKANQYTTIGGKPVEQVYEKIYNKANRLPPAQAQLEYDKAAMLEKMMLDAPPQQLIQYAKDIGSDPRVIQWLEKDIAPKTKVPGAFYKVDIPDAAAKTFLDWDKPLSEQKNVISKITPSSLGLEYKQLPNGNHAFLNSDGKPFGIMQKGGTKESFENRWKQFISMQGSGGDLYKALNQGMSDSAKTSKALNNAGIQGIKYLDQGSRSAGQGTNNFVVFDPNIVKILERN